MVSNRSRIVLVCSSGKECASCLAEVYDAHPKMARRPQTWSGGPGRGLTLRYSYLREEVAMCIGGRLVADFVAGTDARPALPAEFEEHLTTTVNGQWVVWAHKLARQVDELFVPLTGRDAYRADARARCLRSGVRGAHDAPDPGCTCGFHALSSRTLPGLPVGGPSLVALTVALSGRVLAFEWARGGVLWRAERQTVVRVEGRASLEVAVQDNGQRLVAESILSKRRHPGDPDGRPAVMSPVAPRDSGPMRLELPVSAPVLPVCHDDAGWCAVSGTFEYAPRSLVLT